MKSRHFFYYLFVMDKQVGPNQIVVCKVRDWFFGTIPLSAQDLDLTVEIAIGKGLIWNL